MRRGTGGCSQAAGRPWLVAQFPAPLKSGAAPLAFHLSGARGTARSTPTGPQDGHGLCGRGTQRAPARRTGRGHLVVRCGGGAYRPSSTSNSPASRIALTAVR
ncbi:hypothetical protein E4K73_00160 [Streptomyces sp. IB201691-2A2]|nr:hypothetical protein E4K73_00160 [Streptomyces sp. IB201691-2A2]